MKNFIIGTLLIILIFPVLSRADSFSISGEYVDKKENPIANAKVEYIRNGNVIQYTYTDSIGNFNLADIDVGTGTGLNLNIGSGQNYPNPFSDMTRIPVSTTSKGTVSIYNMKGQLLNQIKLPGPGEYEITWGGRSSSGVAAKGTYIYNLTAENGQVSSNKMIKLEGGNGSGLQIASQNSVSQSSSQNKSARVAGSSSSTDIIRFTKENTTLYELSFTPSMNDTTLADIIGNVGYEILSQIADQNLIVGDNMRINLEDYFYNDETGLYQPRNENFIVEADSILTYLAQEAGNFSAWVLATDRTDPALTDSLEVNVIVNEAPDTIPPVITLPDTLEFNEDGYLVVDLKNYATDNVSLPANIAWLFTGKDSVYMSIDANNIATISTINPDWYGLDEIIAEATDEAGKSSTKNTVVKVNPVNDEPTFAGSMPDYNINQGESFEVDISGFNDIDNELSFDIPGMPAGTTYDWNLETKIGTVTPPADSAGIWAVLKVVAIEVGTQEQYTVESGDFSLTIEEIITNNPPYEETPIGNQNSDEGIKLIIPNWRTHVGDDDGDPISLVEILNLQGKATYQEIGNNLEFTPTDENDYSDLLGITLRVTDGTDTLDLTPFDWMRNNVNDAPYEETPIGNQNTDEGVKVIIPNWKTHFGDIEGDAITLDDVLNLNGKATYKEVGDNLELTPTDPDDYTAINGITLRVTDGTDTFDATPFNWTRNNTPDAPYEETPIGDQNTDEGATVIIPNWKTHIGDADGETPALDSILNLNNKATYEEIGNDLHLTPTDPDDYSAINNIVIRAIVGPDTLDLTPFDWTRNNINDAPQKTTDISNIIVPNNQHGKIYLPDHFSDVDNLISDMVVEVLNLSGASYQVNLDTLKILADNPGILTDLIVKLTDPGGLYAQSNQFSMETQPTPMTDVTFTLKAAYADTVLSNGLSTVQWNRKNDPWAADSIRTSTNGIVQISIEQGVEYEVNVLHDGSIDVSRGVVFTKFKGASNEQRAYQDNSSPIIISSPAASITAYKLMDHPELFDDVMMTLMVRHISKDENVLLNIGDRRFGDNDLNAPIWWNANYTASDSTRRAWIDEIVNELAGISHVSLNMQFQEGTEQPSTPYLQIVVDAQYSIPGNATSFDSQTHEIINCRASYPDINVTKYTFRIEIFQAIGDLNEWLGSNPPILNGLPQGYSLNEDGRRMFSAMYLFDPKTKFY